MNGADADPPRADSSPKPPVLDPDGSADLAAPRGCPFLISAAGGWRLDVPSREHRCGAFSPATSLSPEKQTRLCLMPAYTNCATYLASVAARASRLGSAPPDRATRWGLARTTTVIEDPGGVRTWLITQLLDRRRWPAIPAVLLVTTLLTLALSGFRANTPVTAVATSSLGPSRAPTPRPSLPPPPLPSVDASPAPSIEPSTGPTVAPSAAPTPGGTDAPSATFRTYRVKSGDTLSAIASTFHTTSRAIADLNGIRVTTTLHIGQTLKIPNP